MPAVCPRFVAALCTLGLLALAPPAGAATSAGGTSSGAGGGGTSHQVTSQQASLRGFQCVRALDPAGRALSVTAIMRPVPGTRRMAMRFVLLRRPRPGDAAVPVAGAHLGSWIAPADPTTGQRPGDVWKVSHPVIDLTGPATYRFVVQFRWSGRGGRILAKATRRSRRCFESERRADLKLSSLTVLPGQAGRDRYVAVVRNIGHSVAGAFTVELTLGSPGSPTTLPAQSANGLAPHTSLKLVFHGPQCTHGESVMAVADPAGAIDDANRVNNTLVVSCP